jgi:hypothetical protein
VLGVTAFLCRTGSHPAQKAATCSGPGPGPGYLFGETLCCKAAPSEGMGRRSSRSVLRTSFV